MSLTRAFEEIFEINEKSQSDPDAAARAYTDRTVSSNREKNRRLEVRYERLKLVTLAMWELLKHSSNLTDSDLRMMVSQIDIMDGKRDGQAEVKDQLADCTKCQRVILVSVPKCPYCHTENDSYDPIRAM